LVDYALTESQGGETPLLEASIVLLCGLPGSGKSTLRQTIVKHYTAATNRGVSNDEDLLEFDNVVAIDYDEITSSISSKLRSGAENTYHHDSKMHEEESKLYYNNEELLLSGNDSTQFF